MCFLGERSYWVADEEEESMLKDERINWRRLLFEILVGSILFFMVLRGTEAEAAQTVQSTIGGSVGTYTVPDVDDWVWDSWYLTDNAAEYYAPEGLADYITDNFQYMIVLYENGIYSYFFSANTFTLEILSTYTDYAYHPFACLIYSSKTDMVVKVDVSSGVSSVVSVFGCADLVDGSNNLSYTFYNVKNKNLVGSNYDMYLNESGTWSDKVKATTIYNNMTFPNPKLSVDIPVNGVTYTVSEYLPYYLALKEPSGDIQLFFSDVPFTGSFADLYNWRIEIPFDANVVWYYWDSEEQNDFLSSRTVATASTAFDSFYFTSTGDYMSNYSLPETNNPLYYFLTEKAAFNPEALTAKDLYAALPDELSKYYHIIIFRQDSPKAYDDRILFYGWNDNNASLYINSRTSGIAAFNKKGSVSDYATAYYDETSNSWVVTDDVILGTTKDYSYSVPFIYYSDLDLFVCEEFGLWNGQIAYVGDDERPLVSIVDPDSPEADEQDTLIDRFLNGFSTLFKNLFVPSSGFFDAKVNYMKSKFSFYEAISSTGAAILDFFTETDFSEPPKITVNLSAARSKYNYGETAICLDMSWYEEYKPYVDAFLSGVLWLVFGWNTFKNLPSIISGVTTAANVSTEISKASESKPVEIPKYASNAKSCPPEFMIKR